MKRINKKMVTILSVFLCLILLVFTGGNIVGAQEKHETLKIGYAFDITSMGAEWFLPGLNALTMEIERINENGGVKIGDTIYDLKLFTETTDFTAEGARAAAEKLIYKDGVDIIWGAGILHTSTALQDVTLPNNIINLSQCFGRVCLCGELVNNEIVNPYKYTLMIIATSYETTPRIWQYIREAYPDYKRVAEININTIAAHWCTGEIAKMTLPLFGFEMVAEEYYELGLNDFYPILTKILAQNPDVIHFPNVSPTDMALIMKQARELGYGSDKLFLLENPKSPEIVEIAGGKEAVEGLIMYDYPTDGESATLELIDLKKRYTERYGTWVPLVVIPTLPLPAVLEAMQIVGNTSDSDKIMELLTSRRWKTYGVEIAFGGAEYYGVPNMEVFPLSLFQMKNGNWEKVADITIDDQLGFWPKHL